MADTLTFEKFFGHYQNYHSFVDLLNLCKEVSDYIYNEDINDSQFFQSFKENDKGYVIIFDEKKKYVINFLKDSIKDGSGNDIVIDRVYEDIEKLYNDIRSDFIVNIKQMDEKMKTFDEVIEFGEKNEMKTFNRLIPVEPINEGFQDELGGKLSDKYLSLKKGILDLLDGTLKSDITKLQDFMDTYIDTDSEEIIEGFIEDADIFDFYLKYQSDVDQILLDNNYYDDKPEVESLYDYVIDGTFDAVVYCMEEMKKELYGE